MPSPGWLRMSQGRMVALSSCGSPQAQPDRPAGVTSRRDKPADRASSAAAVSCPLGLVKNRQNTAASVRRLIQVLRPVTRQVPSPAGMA